MITFCSGGDSFAGSSPRRQRGLRASCERKRRTSSCVVQLAKVVADQVEGPLALRTGKTAQAELSGVLADLHLSEGRLDDDLSPRVVGTTLLRPESSRHLLAPRRVLRNTTTRCCLELLAAALPPGGGKDVGLQTLGRFKIVLGAVAGIGEERLRRSLDPCLGEVLLGLFGHRDEL